ncbi:MAG: mitofilin family membrane protein [Kiloniellales bacterium]|nr:mitofilin family membrane protein [Kiloniellales bacterium]
MGDDTKAAGNGPDDTSKPSNGGDDTPPALRVIGAFGGIRPMANKLNVPVSTVQGWKERGVIPEARHEDIRTAAKAHQVALDDAELDASAEAPPEPPAVALTGTPSAAVAEPAAEAASETNRPGQPGDERDEKAPAEAPPIAPAIAAAARDSAGSSGDGRSGWLPGFVLGAVVFAVGAGGAVLTKDIWAPAGETGGALTEKLADLERRLGEMEAKPAATASLPDDLATSEDIKRLQGEIAALSGSSDATADLEAQVKDLEARVAALGDTAKSGAEAATATSTALGGLSGEVTAIQASLQDIQASVDELKARNAGQDALLWSAVGALRDALRYAGPFTEELADVSRLAGDRDGFQEALAELKPLADTGVPSLAELQREFPAAAREIVAAGYNDSNSGVLGDVLNRVSQVVTVRPVGDVEGDDTGAIVARAENHVDAGDLEAALEELKGLPADASQAADGWRRRVQQRIAADAAITKLNGLLAGHLAAGG